TALGIRSPTREYSNAYLGSSEMTLEEITLAYTIFPNQGRRPEYTYIISRIEDRTGREIYRAQPRLVRAIPSYAAYQTHHALEKVLTEGTENLAFTRDGLEKFPAAGKNGTAYGFTDVYFFGYTSEVTCGVWIGFDKPTRIYRGAFGRNLAMPVWVRWINAASRKFQPRQFPKPLDLEPVEICAESGLLATPKCFRKNPNGFSTSTTYIEYLTPSQKPKSICDVHAGGIRTYAKTYEESDWPRAAPAIDLSRIRPIAIQDPTIVGFNDIYQAVQPGFSKKDISDIPVAKAIPVEFADGSKADAHSIGQTSEGRSVATAIPVRKPENTEIRRPETIPTPSTIERPAIELQPPPPATF
ncbi:MAG: hypothetical protein NZL93_01640, partial [Chthoniobacterales bacterium]|nr:hypothetical protein [Chthoniobacterales bacterium]